MNDQPERGHAQTFSRPVRERKSPEWHKDYVFHNTLTSKLN